jgi:signal transduction histidine kinase
MIIVSLFSIFTLFYFPAQQRRLLLDNYNSEVQNLSNTVALGVRIAINEQNYEGVQTAMEYVKGNPYVRFVSLLEYDTIWSPGRQSFHLQENVFKTFPENVTPPPNAKSNDSMIVKRTSFEASAMPGAVMLGFSTAGINESQKKIFRTSLLISLAIFLIGLLIGVWLSRKLSAPVLALRHASRRIAKGDLTPADLQYPKDEIGDLARAFNTMVTELSHSREELHTANKELSKTNADLSATLENLKAAQDQLIQAEKMASLGELTAGIAHEIQNPLNFINNFSDVNMELLEELEALVGAQAPEEVLSCLAEIKTNEQKVLHHGKRADTIVKSMLLHSRVSTGKKEPTDINALAGEYLRLSYHGLRAKEKEFVAHYDTAFDEGIGKICIVQQDIGRVLLNLFNNAFYAVNEKRRLPNGNYEPVVSVQTRKAGKGVEIVVRDNGTGISQKVLDKIYQPFFTTKPTGSGTGLGLSLSYDIIKKGHNGEIRVETQEGEGTAFVIFLPGDC